MNNISLDIPKEEWSKVFTPVQLEVFMKMQMNPTLSNDNTIFYYEDRQGFKTVFDKVLRHPTVGFFIGIPADKTKNNLIFHCLRLRVEGAKKAIEI